MEKYILAIDQGTTSTRSIIFNKKGNIISSSQKELTMIYDQPGFVEQDANEIWLSVLTTMAEAMIKANIEPSQIQSI